MISENRFERINACKLNRGPSLGPTGDPFDSAGKPGRMSVVHRGISPKLQDTDR